MSDGNAAIADWALPPSGGPPKGPDTFWRRMSDWWDEFSLQTKLLAIATLVVSLVTVSYTHLTLPTKRIV